MGTAGEARTSEKIRAALMLWGTRWENDTFGICPSTSQVMGSPPAYSAPSPSFAVEPGERVAALDGQPADRRPGEGLSHARPVPDAHQDGDKSGDHNLGFSGHKKVKGCKGFCDWHCNVIAPVRVGPGQSQ